jgi:hypothetical protein
VSDHAIPRLSGRDGHAYGALRLIARGDATRTDDNGCAIEAIVGNYDIAAAGKYQYRFVTSRRVSYDLNNLLLVCRLYDVPRWSSQSQGC